MLAGIAAECLRALWHTPRYPDADILRNVVYEVRVWFGMSHYPLSRIAPRVTALVLLWTLVGCENRNQPVKPGPARTQIAPGLIESGAPVQGAAVRYGHAGEAVVLLLDTSLLDVSHDKWQAWVNEHESSWVAATSSLPPWTSWTTQTNAAWVAISSSSIGFGTGVQAAGSTPWDPSQHNQLLKAHGLTPDPRLFSEQLLSPDGRWGVVIVAAAADSDRARAVP